MIDFDAKPWTIRDLATIPARQKPKPPYAHGDAIPENRLLDLDAVIWSGRQWAVTEYGIECFNGGRYEIEKSRLLENEQHGWISHMAEKGWVDLPDFVAAFGVAVAAHIHGVRELQPR